MRFVLVWLILSSALPLAPAGRSDRFVVWNVGQGLWVTWIEADVCRHFDAGGETKPIRRLRPRCRQKQNELYLSHWDWDHVGGVGPLRAALPNLCLAARPGGTNHSKRKLSLLKDLRPCAGSQIPHLRELLWSRSGKSSNDASRIWMLRGNFLLPGDSTARQERFWAAASALAPIRGLVLGHHGSQTSTSDFLLGKLPNLKWAVASARKKRYGHPHKVISERLRKHRIPLLSTEDWGHLIFQL
jgi:competence protein ComEC